MNFAFHHIGVATDDIAREEQHWTILSYRREGAEFADERLGIRGVFLVGGGPRLELVEALPGSKILETWLAHGVKLYHMAYEVEALDDGIAQFKKDGAKLSFPPTPAVAFGGARVCFLTTRNRQLVELIERSAARGAGPNP